MRPCDADGGAGASWLNRSSSGLKPAGRPRVRDGGAFLAAATAPLALPEPLAALELAEATEAFEAVPSRSCSRSAAPLAGAAGSGSAAVATLSRNEPKSPVLLDAWP